MRTLAEQEGVFVRVQQGFMNGDFTDHYLVIDFVMGDGTVVRVYFQVVPFVSRCLHLIPYSLYLCVHSLYLCVLSLTLDDCFRSIIGGEAWTDAITSRN